MHNTSHELNGAGPSNDDDEAGSVVYIVPGANDARCRHLITALVKARLDNHVLPGSEPGEMELPRGARYVTLLADSRDAAARWQVPITRWQRDGITVCLWLPPDGNRWANIGDLASAGDDDAVAQALDGDLARDEGRLFAPEADRSQPACVTRCLADIEPTPIAWLWESRLALGKLNLIAGQPCLGKSQLTALLAATVTNGGLWPDGARAPRGSVVMISCEDDVADTVVPRMIAVGADLSRVHVLDWRIETDENGQLRRRIFDIGRDAEALRTTANQIGEVRLIVIDPISAYVGKVDSHKNSDVRGALAPLQEVAAEIGACVILVSHLNKGSTDGAAMSRVSGSGAFVAAARSAWLVAQHPSDEQRRVFTPLKNNIGDDQTGFAYEIKGVILENGISTSCVEIDPTPVRVSPEEALTPSNGDEAGRLEDAEEFLREELRDGVRPVKYLKKAVDDAGHKWRTIERAKERLGVIARKGGFGEGWSWELPTAKAAKNPEDRQDRHSPMDARDGGVGCRNGTRHEVRQDRPPKNLGGLGGLGGLQAVAPHFDDDVEEGRI
ncbi:MAG: AAA family ATPase [Pseudomonadota bacterium]